MPSTPSITGCPAGANAIGATSATATSPNTTRCRTDVHSASGVCRVYGPVAGVAATTYSIAAAAQQAPHESATARHIAATGRRWSRRAHTVTTAIAMPIANHTKKCGSHRPICVCRSGTNMKTTYTNESAPYTPIARSSRFARTPGSRVGTRLAYQASSGAVSGSSAYQAASTTRLHVCPMRAGPRPPPHHGSGRYVCVSVSSEPHVSGSPRCPRADVTMKTAISAQYAGMIRSTRLSRYSPVRGAARPSSAAAAHGR